MRLTNAEYNFVIKELAERLRDMVILEPEKLVKKYVSKDHVKHILESRDNDTKLTFHYEVNMCTGDVFHLISRYRRTKK